ncbi:MAG: GNAT family N-acetyltransferase [Myxococcales bacterium]|nr:GNAT family N-acetyltransferase [Myxococcales bacterium]
MAMASAAEDKIINLERRDQIVPTAALRAAYVHYEASLNPGAPSHVELADGLELGIVSSAVPAIARAISAMLSRSLEGARNDRGGHLPPAVVARVQREIISPHGVAHLWGTTGHRFVLSRARGDGRSELLATVLVGQSKDTIFFFTGRYNNLRHSTIAETVDFDQPAADDPGQRWFDLFAFPDLVRFKPTAYHQIANFVVAPEHRGEGLAKTLLAAIVAKYARDHLVAVGAPIEHSQHLLCGRGLWQIGDPPWLERMQRLGFYLRWGAESFFIERAWAPLPPIFGADGRPIANREYNASFGLPRRYLEGGPPNDSPEHLLDRVPAVVRLAEDPRAKLQYFQTMFDFR